MSHPAGRPPLPPMPAARPTGAAEAALYERLDAVLRALLAEHEGMLSIVTEHRHALASANSAALGACLERHAEAAQRVALLERERQTVVATLAGIPTSPHHPGRAAAAAPTMSALTARAPEPVRARLAGLAAALRDLLNALHREHVALKAAAETLSSHMEGLMRQVCRRLSHAGTYGRAGAVDSSVQVVSALDLRS